MSKKDFLKSVRKTIDQSVPESVFGREDQERATSREAIKGTKGLKGARTILIDKIKPDPDQPRKTFIEDSINELAASIKAHGVLQPITVEYLSVEDTYKIIAGERRFLASKVAGLSEIPCVIREELDGNKRKALQLVENLQREDLRAIDKARALLDYKNDVGSWEEVERLTGLSTRRRQQFIAILKLPDEIQSKIVSLGGDTKKKVFTEKHARALLSLKKNPEKQKELFELIVDAKNPLASREVIEKAKEFKGKLTQKTLVIRYSTKKELIEKLEQELSRLRS
jgi:ParB family chromosome partitioning protein